MKSRLEGVSETLLIPLWARATETKGPQPIVRDEYAVDLVEKIDYDFSKFERARMSQVGVSIRTMLLDYATKAFINVHPDCAIVNIGAGLDTRYFRVDNGRIRWYDLDLPEPIRIRKNFFDESSRYKMIAKSVFDFSWQEDVETANLPVLFIAEGVFVYFEEAEVKHLMSRLAADFSGAEMLFEMMTPTLVKMQSKHDSVSKTDAVFKWGIKSGRETEAFHPDIRFIEEWNYFDFHKDRWKWMRWPAMIPAIKNRMNNRIVHLRFV